MAVKKPSLSTIFKQTLTEFSNDNVTKLAASLAYYTLFSMGPLILIVISVAGIFFEENAISGSVYSQIRDFVGEDTARSLIDISNNMRVQRKGAFFVGIGIVVLIFGATGVFADMQDSLNIIWSIKAKPKRSWLKYLTSRLLSFSLVIGLGFLLIVSLVINTLLEILSSRLLRFLGEGEVVLAAVLNYGIILTIITTLFAVIYKVLPDARIRWRDTFVGALFTGVLFMLGKFAIGYYLGTTSIGTQYGATASVIILLLWVNYSALILYFGAEFTKVWALNRGRGILPSDAAVFVRQAEVEELAFHPKDRAVDPSLRGAPVPVMHLDAPSAAEETTDGTGGEKP